MHEQLGARLLQGEVAAAARACRIVDERWPGHLELLEALYPHTLGAWLIGVTGSPGVGKSTLVSRLIEHFRAGGSRVGVVAVDPSSPFSGGAILGDRIRMQSHFADAEVFIRSVATRGAVGGLSRTTADMARVLMAWGAHVVLIETIGVGQDELDVMRVAHTTLVVQAPGAGDDVQAAKAGLMECADVFVVNKADLPGAEEAASQLRGMLAIAEATRHPVPLGQGHSGALAWPAPREFKEPAALGGSWQVPVLTAVAARAHGIAELVGELERHKGWLDGTEQGALRRRARLRQELAALIRDAVTDAILDQHADEIESAVERITERETDPYAASRNLVSRFAGVSPSLPVSSLPSA